MKKLKIITTFSKNGYEVYGKTWLNTFCKNVKDPNITVDVYVDFPLDINDSRIHKINFNLKIPHHKSWVDKFYLKYVGAPYNKKMGVRFSYKSFVMQHALKNNSNCYIIWLDGDCIFKPSIDFLNFPQNILNNKFIAVQRENNGGNDHCESGFVAFDADHKDKEKFLNQFINNYKIENIIHIDSPYDGFIIYRSLNGIDYTNLNDVYGREGIQSDPNETFLHPELNKRFLHNIGITGKNKYNNFKNYINKDEFFKIIVGRDTKTDKQIHEIRKKLLCTRQK